MLPMPPHVQVGVGVFVLEGNAQENPRFLMAKRKNSHGAGTYSILGGHLEFGEDLETCAAREVLEESGLRVTNVRFLTAINSYMPTENKHYITIFMSCVRESGEAKPEVLEPDRQEAWEWVGWQDLLRWSGKESEAGKSDTGERRLFQPLLDLLQQRPGVVPTSV